MRSTIVLAALLGTIGLAQADDTASLSIADQAPPLEPATASDWRVVAEAAIDVAQQRSDASIRHGRRLSWDVSYDRAFHPGWRAVFADRLDLNSTSSEPLGKNINTLKEAYVSWLPTADLIWDIGRVNVRNGVASGYNPTDFFRASAIRSIVSADPNSLRNNRQGSVILRSQLLWSDGSFSFLYSPKLASLPSNNGYDVDLGATNNRRRWLLSVSQRISPSLTPQCLLYGVEGDSSQFGCNITGLINDATVGFIEWAGGRSSSLVSQINGESADRKFRNRLAAGVTYTTATKISITAEYDYNGAAPDKAMWNMLRNGTNPVYLRYRALAQSIQEPPLRRNLFFHGTWQDAMIMHLDLTAMARLNLVDRSRMSWLEIRYHWKQSDIVIRRQAFSGDAGTEFGYNRQSNVWQLLFAHFF